MDTQQAEQYAATAAQEAQDGANTAQAQFKKDNKERTYSVDENMILKIIKKQN
jgi:hypothetical protein